MIDRRATPREIAGMSGINELTGAGLSISVTVTPGAPVHAEARLGVVVSCPNCRAGSIVRAGKGSCGTCGNVWNADRQPHRMRGGQG